METKKESPRPVVLVVDNSQVARQELVDAICDSCDIITAENGADALAKFEKFRPLLVTLGVKMPLMDGPEVLSRILAIDKKAKVVMVTAVDDKNTLEKCFQSGAIGYIVKPFAKQEISSTIRIAQKLGPYNDCILFIFTKARRSVRDIMRNVGKIPIEVTLDDVNVFSPEGGGDRQGKTLIINTRLRLEMLFQNQFCRKTNHKDQLAI